MFFFFFGLLSYLHINLFWNVKPILFRSSNETDKDNKEKFKKSCENLQIVEIKSTLSFLRHLEKYKISKKMKTYKIKSK